MRFARRGSRKKQKIDQAAAESASAPGCAFYFFLFLVLLVNDSEYSELARQ
jgi:hypothetical protein